MLFVKYLACSQSLLEGSSHPTLCGSAILSCSPHTRKRNNESKLQVERRGVADIMNPGYRRPEALDTRAQDAMLDRKILCRIRSFCNGYRLFASLVTAISRRCPLQPIIATSHIQSDSIE